MKHLRAPTLFVAGALVAGCGASPSGDGTNEDDGGVDTGDAGVPEQPESPYPDAFVALDTIVPEQAVAGTAVAVRCIGVDAFGLEYELDESHSASVRVWPPESFLEAEADLELLPVVAGTAHVSCSLSAMSLTDDTPAALTIVPGEPYTSQAWVDPELIVAGDTAAVECDVRDEWGNRHDSPGAEIVVTPKGDGVSVLGDGVEIERTGTYSVSCHLDGLAEERARRLDVIPDLPATILVGRLPDLPSYRTAQVVEIVPEVLDFYGNRVYDVPVQITSDPEGLSFGTARFRYDTEGEYTVEARVDPPTASGEPLIGETTVIVSGDGPDITCDNPVDGGFMNVAPGTEITFRGTVSDPNGVRVVTVAGEAVAPTPEGVYTATVETRFGVNFIDVVAEDGYGATNSRTCVFLAANQWAEPGMFLSNGVMLRLAQAAMDDGDSGDLDSLNDLLVTVLNSRGLVDALDQGMRDANPLKRNSCDQEFCWPWGGCDCIFRSEVNYRGGSFRLGGPHTTTLTLVDGGLRAVATVRDINLEVRVSGTVSTNIEIRVAHVTVDVTFDVFMDGDRPGARVRRVNDVDVGEISFDIDSILDPILDILVDIFQNQIRDIVADTIRDYVSSEFNAVLDGVFSNLDISTLGASFDVPRIGTGGTIPIGFGIDFSSVNVNPTRALFGLGTRFTSEAIRPDLTNGAPIPPGVIGYDPPSPMPVAASVNIGILNQALHALWRAGLFDMSLGADYVGGGLPDDFSAVLETRLPAVAVGLGEGAAQVMLGGVRLTMAYPGFIDEPLTMDVGAVAQTSLTLVDGDRVVFGDIEIVELYFSTPLVSLEPEARDLIESLVVRILQAVIDDSVNSALPHLPLPSFELPAELGVYGLPAGEEMGLVSPSLTNTPSHFVLESAFGVL